MTVISSIPEKSVRCREVCTIKDVRYKEVSLYVVTVAEILIVNLSDHSCLNSYWRMVSRIVQIALKIWVSSCINNNSKLKASFIVSSNFSKLFFDSSVTTLNKLRWIFNWYCNNLNNIKDIIVRNSFASNIFLCSQNIRIYSPIFQIP